MYMLHTMKNIISQYVNIKGFCNTKLIVFWVIIRSVLIKNVREIL